MGRFRVRLHIGGGTHLVCVCVHVDIHKYINTCIEMYI